MRAVFGGTHTIANNSSIHWTDVSNTIAHTDPDTLTNAFTHALANSPPNASTDALTKPWSFRRPNVVTNYGSHIFTDYEPNGAAYVITDSVAHYLHVTIESRVRKRDHLRMGIWILS